MKKTLNKIRNSHVSWLVLFLGIIFLGIFLRLYNLEIWPRKGATFDEYAWTWQGMNIIQKGVPISWSPHAQYENAHSIIYQQTHFRIVEPFLEHPPVFGLISGGFALMSGARDMYDVNISHIRPLALILGSLSILFIFLLTTTLYGRSTGLLVSLLYATIPTIVVGSRIVQNENFFIPVWLFVLYMAAKYIKGKKRIYRNIAIFLSFLLILAKIPWIAAGISLFAIFLFHKKYKDAFLVALSSTLALGVFGLYGYFYDWNLFINLWKLQSARYDITFTSIYALFQKPYLVDRYYTDGWIFFGWFSFVLLLLKNPKKNVFIIAPMISYFLIFLAGVPDEAGHGWYRYPFYPFLIISIGLFLNEYFAKNFLLTFLFLVMVGTALLGNTWEKVFGFSFVLFRIAILSWSLILIPYFPISKNRVKFPRIVSYCWIVLFIIMNIWSALIYNEQ